MWRCTPKVAQAVVTDQARLRAAERSRLVEQGLTGADLDRRVDEHVAPVWFDGDELVLDETVQHGEPAIDRQRPGPDGRYCPMGYHWTWTAVDPAACDRIAGVLPALGEHREYAVASHQPLQMPHNRLTITALDETTTDEGIARTATLSLDGQPIGTIPHGPGRPPVFRPSGARFSTQDLVAFADACRWRGRAVDTETVLQVLIAEYRPA